MAASRGKCGHCIARHFDGFCRTEFLGCTSPPSGEIEWGAEVAFVQARPGSSLLAGWSWWWAAAELSGLMARLGNSGQKKDGRDLRLLWRSLQALGQLLAHG